MLRGEDLLSSTPRQIALYEALTELGIADGAPRVRPPALRHGRGQQEALQARPRGARCSRYRDAGLPARGPAQLPRPARLGDRRRPRRLLARRRWSRRSTSPTSTPTRRASTSRRPRRSTPPTCGCCRSTRSPTGCCRSSRRPASSPTRSTTPTRSCSSWRCRWSPSGSTSSPRPSTCWASSSSTRPRSPATDRASTKLLDDDGRTSSRRRTTRSTALHDVVDRRHPGRAAGRAGRGARPQAAATPSARCGSRSPAAGSRRRCSSRWSCSAATAAWRGCRRVRGLT